jgi:hypothetical protein
MGSGRGEDGMRQGVPLLQTYTSASCCGFRWPSHPFRIRMDNGGTLEEGVLDHGFSLFRHIARVCLHGSICMGWRRDERSNHACLRI